MNGSLKTLRRRAALPAAACVIAAATVPIGSTHADAQGAAPQAAFVNGSAQGVAQAIRIAPGIGSFQAAVAIGTSIAGYDETEGKASAQNLDLGAVGTSLTGPQCDGSNPTVTGTQIPQPLIAESAGGQSQSKQADLVTDASNLQNTDGSKPGTQTLPASSPADAGVLTAESSPTPSGKASTQGGAFSLAKAVTISGASSGAQAAVVGGNARDVTATAGVGSISIAGLVTLGNIVETVHQRTGAGATSDGTFSIGSIKVGGVALPAAPAQLVTSLNAVNAAIATTGFHVTPPVFQKMPDGSAVMTPLTIGLTNSPLLHEGVEPILSSASALTAQVENQLISANCQAGNAFSIGDLFVVGPASGAGSLNLLIGGVSAVSEGTAYTDPFGGGAGLGSGPELGSTTTGTTIPGSPGTAGTPGTSGTLGGSSGTAPQTGSAPSVAAAPGLSDASSQTVIGALCDTTHIFQHPGCSGNHAVPVALVALVGVLGLGYADAMAGRGRLRRRGKELDQLKL